MPKPLKKASVKSKPLFDTHTAEVNKDRNMEEEATSDEWTGPLTKRDLGMLNRSILSMKDEFASLLRSELTTFKTEINKELQTLTDATAACQQRITDNETATETQAARTSHMEEEIGTLKKTMLHLQLKNEDLENRSRRGNIRIKGLKEGTEGDDLLKCVQDLIATIMPDTLSSPMELDRWHRVGPAQGLTEGRPRDILVKPHNFGKKEQLMKAARKQPEWEFQGSLIQMFQDIGLATLARRREFRNITEALTQKTIRYRWLYPFGLAFDNHVIHSVEEGIDILQHQYNVIVEQMEARPEGARAQPSWGSPTRKQRRSRSRRRRRDQVEMEQADI